MKCLVGSILLSLLVVMDANSARPSFVPPGAYWRIDRHNATPASSTGQWMEMGVYEGEDGDWGQGKCVAYASSECHLNDYCTWWYMVSPPAPPSGYTPVEFGTTGFPAGNDPNTGAYYY